RMDFALTDTQKEVAELAGKVLGSTRDADTLWARAAEAGLLGVAIAEEAGGAGHDLLAWCALMTAAGATAAPIPLWAASVAAMAIDRFGTPAQRALLPDLVTGVALAVPAFTREPGTGAWTAVPSATRATRILIVDGDAMQLVDPAAPGVTVEAQTSTTGEPCGRVTLSAAAPREPLGPPGAATWLRERATVGLCALELGIVERVLAMTAKYTTERVQFDRPIATFQAVAQRAADAYIDVEVIRLTMWQAAWRLAQELPAAGEIAVAKFFAAEGGQRVTYAAQHLHGGIGFDLDYPLARYYPLSKQTELTLGGAYETLARLGALLAE
ncbi:MAG TPA: acyl-CoA dehydrogenase family protein, partial [Kofleriaceae bacterium]|nr:acyl-CoA dehydrogenase family protein [Kofleriaceae bacterium]